MFEPTMMVSVFLDGFINHLKKWPPDGAYPAEYDPINIPSGKAYIWRLTLECSRIARSAYEPATIGRLVAGLAELRRISISEVLSMDMHTFIVALSMMKSNYWEPLPSASITEGKDKVAISDSPRATLTATVRLPLPQFKVGDQVRVKPGRSTNLKYRTGVITRVEQNTYVAGGYFSYIKRPNGSNWSFRFSVVRPESCDWELAPVYDLLLEPVAQMLAKAVIAGDMAAASALADRISELRSLGVT